MTNKNLTLSLATLLEGTVTGDTLFVGPWAIRASLTGNVQMRYAYDDCIRFGIGTCNDSAETIAKNFREVLDSDWYN